VKKEGASSITTSNNSGGRERPICPDAPASGELRPWVGGAVVRRESARLLLYVREDLEEFGFTLRGSNFPGFGEIPSLAGRRGNRRYWTGMLLGYLLLIIRGLRRK